MIEKLNKNTGVASDLGDWTENDTDWEENTG